MSHPTREGARVLAAFGVSALGLGDAAFRVEEVGSRPTVAIARDEELSRAGLVRPHVARVGIPRDESHDRATEILCAALAGCLAELEAARPAWRRERVGIVLGSSSGGMLSAERCFPYLERASEGEPLAPALARRSAYFSPFEEAVRRAGVDLHPRSQILGACASSTLALGIGLRWLTLGRCDLVLAGGYDAVSLFVAAGFEALLATTATLPRPFRVGRDGMALGEGAAVLALARDASGEAKPPRGFLLGFGAATDAVHVTAPDRTGAALARASEMALSDAGVPARDVGLVSAHATATPFNDAAEAKALRRIFAGGELPPVHPFKAQIGHTLGAAGALESLAILDAMARGIAPAAAGEGEIDPECAVPLLDRSQRCTTRFALKTSSAFGGANASLVWATTPGARPERRPRPVYLREFAVADRGAPEVRLPSGVSHPNLGRVDPLGRLVLAAVAALLEAVGPSALAGAGLVVGHGLASLETNAIFDLRRRERGPRHVEPRRFPATSPNVCAGECAIAFQLTGPSFAVGASLRGGSEALEIARDLVATGDADRMVVVGVDLDGAVSRALLAAAGWPPLGQGACAALLSADPASARARVPGELFAAGPTGGYGSLLAAIEALLSPRQS
jgi:3-oxoacyl-[acyl-carrier-protein] synthase II